MEVRETHTNIVVIIYEREDLVDLRPVDVPGWYMALASWYMSVMPVWTSTVCALAMGHRGSLRGTLGHTVGRCAIRNLLGWWGLCGTSVHVMKWDPRLSLLGVVLPPSYKIQLSSGYEVFVQRAHRRDHKQQPNAGTRETRGLVGW